jgi:glycosyltransferase involved in cell wall biosynthesis
LAAAPPELSAIVLCFAAGQGITRITEPLLEQLREAEIDFELVLVANRLSGDGDPTSEVVEELGAKYPEVVPVLREKQGGMGWDMRSGFDAARGRTLVVIDGDTQNPVGDVLRMYREMHRTGAEVMKGRRIARFDGPYRRAQSFVFNAAFRVLFGTQGLWDMNGKPKGLTRAAYERITIKSDYWFADAEMMIKAQRMGMEIAEMPVIFRQNADRASLVRPSAIWEFVVAMLKARIGRY